MSMPVNGRNCVQKKTQPSLIFAQNCFHTKSKYSPKEEFYFQNTNLERGFYYQIIMSILLANE